jgi:polyphosphate kinase 2 (PPK2 family)
VKVHPEFVAHQRIPDANPEKKKFWEHRYESINDFEKHLARNGTHVVKFFLHVSKEEQKNRLLARIEDPSKNWKFEPNDLNERDHWSDYMDAFETMLRNTSTKHAPWYVLPADKKWVCRTLVGVILANEIAKLDLKYPEPDEKLKSALAECRLRLESKDA